MAELQDLYQDVILDHSRRPRNFRVLEQPAGTAEGYNPLCGDRVTVYVDVDGDVIRQATFQGSGCAISSASASLMTGAVGGRTRAEAERLFELFQRMVTGQLEKADAALGKLAVFEGVRAFPVRVKCATLPWHTLRAALEGRAQPVSTE